VLGFWRERAMMKQASENERVNSLLLTTGYKSGNIIRLTPLNPCLAQEGSL